MEQVTTGCEAHEVDDGKTHHVLMVAEPGCLATALRDALEQAGHAVTEATPDDDDLFEQAVGHDTLVYTPAPSLLEGSLDPRPSEARARAALAATNAPGVSLFVMVAPEKGYEAEEDAVQRHGVPYMIIRSTPAVEELGEKLAAATERRLWLPKGGLVCVAPLSRISQYVTGALDDERVGRMLDVPADRCPIAQACRRAVGSAPPKISSMPAPVFRILSPDRADLAAGGYRALAWLMRMPRPASMPAMGVVSDAFVGALAVVGLPLALAGLMGLGFAALIVAILSVVFAWPLVLLSAVLAVVALSVRSALKQADTTDENNPPKPRPMAMLRAQGAGSIQ